MCRSRDISAREEASANDGKSRHRGKSQEDERNLTFEYYELGVSEPHSAEISLAVYEKLYYRRTHRQTVRQLYFI